MSLQHSGQKSRRLGSPSRVSGPMRATKSFWLSSPSSLSSSSSSTPLTLNSSFDGGKRRSSSTTFWTEKLVSPGYSGLTKERKSARDNPVETIRRSASFDTIASSYLCGEWPRPRPSHPLIHLNLVHCPIVLTADKWTQTADDADEQSEVDGQLQRRSVDDPCLVCGGSGLREMKSRLCSSTKVSPLTCNGCGGGGGYFSGADGATGLAAPPRSNAIVIPVVSRRNPLAPCQGSAEGFNQEIEKLVRNTGTLDSDHDLSKTQALTPDGHRAPIADLLNMRSVNTQTPSGGPPSSHHSGIEKHFLRILVDSSSDDSPCLPIIPGAGDHDPLLLFNQRPASTESDRSDQCEQPISGTASPESFMPLMKTCEKRGAPEGCEKIEVEFSKTTEAPIKREIYHALPPSPVKTSNFLKCLIPSERSAFCPLLKKYVSQQTILSFSLSTAGNENDNSIEAK